MTRNRFFTCHHITEVGTPRPVTWSETGVGDGLGYTINLPLSKDVQDPDMLFLYSKVPNHPRRGVAYKPELIFVAAGFDGHSPGSSWTH